jgi:hypothetical protein
MKLLKVKPSPLVGEILRAVEEAQNLGKIQTAAQAQEYVLQVASKISKKEGMTNGNSFNGCHSDSNNSEYELYNFEKYYGRNSYKNGYSDKYYEYPVYTDKNYKNFSYNGINYNDVYDAVYDNIQTKGTKQNINNILNLMN